MNSEFLFAADVIIITSSYHYDLIIISFTIFHLIHIRSLRLKYHIF